MSSQGESHAGSAQDLEAEGLHDRDAAQGQDFGPGTLAARHARNCRGRNHRVGARTGRLHFATAASTTISKKRREGRAVRLCPLNQHLAYRM